jgi:(2Fe-2S) ferredoxin
MTNVIIKQDAQLSEYGNAPVVEVRVPGMDVVKYKQVNPALTVEILEKHVRDKNILDEHVFA